MANDNTQMPLADLLEQLAIRERQLEQLQQAYVQLQASNINAAQGRLFKTVNHLATFTGIGEISINSFFSSVEYLLQSIQDPELKREVTRTIFYRTIQGQAKDAVINVPEPDNWELIKATLKLRYRPDTEPHQIYRRICDLRVNTISELAVEIQNIKYKTDELIVHHKNDNFIDLSNVESWLVNTVKEVTQGTLLDKIYEEKELGAILKIMMLRRYENSCIRYQYRKVRTNRNNAEAGPINKNQGNINQNSQQQNYRNFNQNNAQPNDQIIQQNYRNFNQNNVQQNNQQFSNNQNNRNQQQNYRYNNSGQFRQNNTQPNLRSNSGQSRQNQNYQQSGSHQSRLYRPGNAEPMEIDNLEADQNRNNDNDQYQGDDYNDNNDSNDQYSHHAEVNNTVFFMKQPRNAYH
ncbi:GATA zinc finger domain-containing protein 14-like [Anastrepha ludens]|uniref:GATA zinc finger domain-containing protein 14-like n=1 Tax=Anastrepha ludens TaxID=28586 RepID=UPI0023B16117|nr:GATA zinc finger domain-containing protein 14-like [Anastrepha ludens]